MGAFYAAYPQFLSGIPKMAGLMYAGSLLLCLILWLMMRFGGLLQQVFGGNSPSAAQKTA